MWHQNLPGCLRVGLVDTPAPTAKPTEGEYQLPGELEQCCRDRWAAVPAPCRPLLQARHSALALGRCGDPWPTCRLLCAQEPHAHLSAKQSWHLLGADGWELPDRNTQAECAKVAAGCGTCSSWRLRHGDCMQRVRFQCGRKPATQASCSLAGPVTCQAEPSAFTLEPKGRCRGRGHHPFHPSKQRAAFQTARPMLPDACGTRGGGGGRGRSAPRGVHLSLSQVVP